MSCCIELSASRTQLSERRRVSASCPLDDANVALARAHLDGDDEASGRCRTIQTEGQTTTEGVSRRRRRKAIMLKGDAREKGRGEKGEEAGRCGRGCWARGSE